MLTPTPVNFLPGPIAAYAKQHHHTIAQAHKSMNAVGKMCYKVDIKGGGELLFDQDGKPVK